MRMSTNCYQTGKEACMGVLVSPYSHEAKYLHLWCYYERRYSQLLYHPWADHQMSYQAFHTRNHQGIQRICSSQIWCYSDIQSHTAGVNRLGVYHPTQVIYCENKNGQWCSSHIPDMSRAEYPSEIGRNKIHALVAADFGPVEPIVAGTAAFLANDAAHVF